MDDLPTAPPPPAPDPVPPDDYSAVLVRCDRCGKFLASLDNADEAYGRWLLVGADGTTYGRRATELHCGRHGSRGTWRAVTLLRRARAVWADFTVAERARTRYVTVRV